MGKTALPEINESTKAVFSSLLKFKRHRAQLVTWIFVPVLFLYALYAGYLQGLFGALNAWVFLVVIGVAWAPYYIMKYRLKKGTYGSTENDVRQTLDFINDRRK